MKQIEVKETVEGDNIVEFDASDLSSGTYIMSARLDGSVYNSRLFVVSR